MRLLNTKKIGPHGNFEITEFWDEFIPPYAILSHTWGPNEVTLQDMSGPEAQSKEGYKKIEECCRMANDDDLDYAWVDTCCIDKTSSAELSEAINSMYSWYEQSKICYAFLADVPSQQPFEKSRWFTRGWTLQELIAPSEVIFFDEKWAKIEVTSDLQKLIVEATGIPAGIISREMDLDEFSVAQRMSWASKRQTSRIEDRAYSLLGLFDVNMPLIYGEKEKSFLRLQEEIMRISDDHTLFAWRSTDPIDDGLLARSPAAFADSHNIVQWNPFNTIDTSFFATNRGVHLNVHFMGRGPRGLGLAILNCREVGSDRNIAIYVRDTLLRMQQFDRVLTGELESVNLKDHRLVSYSLRNICLRAYRTARLQKRLELDKNDSTIKSEDIPPVEWLRTFMDGDGSKAFSAAATEGQDDIVWLLLTRSDMFPDLRESEDDPTPLMRASADGKNSTIRLLLDRGADIEKTCDIGDFGQYKHGRGYRTNPLLLAAENDRVSSIELLLERGANIEATDNWSSQTPLLLAISRGHESSVKLLLDKGANIKNGNSLAPLSYAAASGKESIVDLLLSRGADIEKKGYHGTPLHSAVEQNNEAIVNLLLDKGANIEASGKSNRTPLSYAVLGRQEPIAKLLIDRGANIEARDNWDRTPLALAASVDRDNGAVINLLLNRGSNIETTNREDRTPLLLATEAGQEPNAKLLIDRGANIEAIDRWQQTPLITAVKKNNLAMVKLLLDKGANIEAADDISRTPLLSAANVNRNREAMIKLLLDRGANIEAVDKSIRTPLLLATVSGQESDVKLLIDRGANIEATDRWRQTSLLLAVNDGHRSIVKLLLDIGANREAADENGNTPLLRAGRDDLIAKLFQSEV